MTAEILVAAHDAPEELKSKAQFQCDGKDDQVQINDALQWFRRILLSPGIFYIGPPDVRN